MKNSSASITTFVVSLLLLTEISFGVQRSVSSESLEENDKVWLESYNKAQSSCKEFEALTSKDFPTEEIKAVSVLRYSQKCEPNKNVVQDVKDKWLKKDAIITGLRETKSAILFANYYEQYLKMNANDRASIEFLERAKLYRKHLGSLDPKVYRTLFNKMLDMFPSFYVEYGRKVPEKKLFEAAYGLRMQRKFNEARKIYDQIILESKRDLKNYKTVYSKTAALRDIFRAYEYSRVIRRVENKKELGIKELKEGFTFFGNYVTKDPNKAYLKFYTDIAVQLARDIWTEGRVTEARTLLERVAKHAPKGASLDQVYWVLGRMDQEKENFKGAISFFEKAIKEKPDKDFELKLLWLIAWSAKKDSQLDRALDTLSSLEKKTRGPQYESTHHKSLFWQAMIHREQNKDSKSNKILKKVVKGNPWGYYGRLALLEVDPEAYHQTLSVDPKLGDSDIVDSNKVRTINLLLAMDESKVLSEYLSDLWRSIGRSKRRKLDTRLQFLAWSNDSGLLKENQQMLEIFDADSKSDLFERAPSFFYPQPYLATVQTYAKKFKVPQEIVYSIMRQESLFDKKARSPADAFGLLQLLPRVASRHTKEAGVTFKEPEELYDPDVVLPLGIAHLSELLKRFDKSMVLTAASYNAGVNPVRGWLRSRYRGNTYEFMEDIPYLETEFYTKLVFRNLSFYVQFNKDLKGKERVELLRSYFNINHSNDKLTSK